MNNKKSSNLPRDLHVDEDKYEMFKELEEEEIFKKTDAPMKTIFLYAMAIGWHHKQRVPLKKKKPSIPSSSISKPDERWTKERWLLNAIAVAETRDIDIIRDGEEVAKIAEEYANYGIDILYNMRYDKIRKQSDFYQILDLDISRVIKSYKSTSDFTLL
jgi:dnd system-associated protein 4